MQEEIKAQINSEELQRIKWDAQLTREYIVRKMQELSPDLVVHAQYYLDNIMKSWDITKKTIEQLLSEVWVAAYNQFISFNKITK
jgi:endonuclease IV